MSLSSDDATVKRQRVSRAWYIYICPVYTTYTTFFNMLSSDLCRKKKIKCDGTAPVCSNCQAFNLECSYKDTTKKVSHY